MELIASGFNFPEGPRTDERGRLYFTDVLGSGLHRYSDGHGVTTFLRDRRGIGGCVFDDDGGIICSGVDGLAYFDPSTESSHPIPTNLDGVSFGGVNDLEADPHGNLYGGTIDFEAYAKGEPPRPGMLFRMKADGTVTKLAVVATPNGMAFSPDGHRLFLSETGDGLYRYDLDRKGDLSNRHLISALEDSDGIALDSDGGLWVARFLSNEVIRISAEGLWTDILHVPFNGVASLTFGGDDLRDLYIVGGDLKESGRGGVVRTRAHIPGMPTYKTSLDQGLIRGRREHH